MSARAELRAAPVSHSAELVRGDFLCCVEGPLIRPSGTFSQGEKGGCWPHCADLSLRKNGAMRLAPIAPYGCLRRRGRSPRGRESPKTAQGWRRKCPGRYQTTLALGASMAHHRPSCAKSRVTFPRSELATICEM